MLPGDLIAATAADHAARALGARVVLTVLLGGPACLQRQAVGSARVAGDDQ
jgi:hypothetical protein